MLQQRRTVVFILAAAALIGGFVTGRGILFTLAYLLGLLLIVSFLWAWANINWLHLSRVTRTRRTQVGSPLDERFQVRNTSMVPKLWVEVRDFSNLPGHFSSQVINGLGARSTYGWRVSTICRERGRYQLGPMRIASSDPFGLFPMTRELDQTSHVVVYPLTFDIHQFTLPLGLLPGGDALRRRTHYVTTNASGVRDYAPGDSFNRIHWASTARRNRLIVKEFELDPLADIWIVPDMAEFGQVGVPRPGSEAWMHRPFWEEPKETTLPDSTEEYVVSIAASLAQYFLRLDRSVGMLAYGQIHEVVQPDRSERQMNRILETLSVLRAQGNTRLSDVVEAEMHLFPRGTTVIVVTASAEDHWATTARAMSRRGLRVVSVLVDPASFGGARSSAGLADLLQANHQVAYTVNRGDDLTAALSK